MISNTIMTNIVIIKSKKKQSLIFALPLGIWRVFFPKERREVNVVGEVEEELLVGLVKVQHRVLICTLFGPDIFKLLDVNSINFSGISKSST